MNNKRILDVCCGGRMFWFDKQNPNVLFVDNRVMDKKIMWTGKGKYEGKVRYFEVKPDKVMDFRHLDLPDNSFSLVVFDPPHLIEKNSDGYQKIKYGVLSPETWKDDLRKGFTECFRVLKQNGVLIFKWNDFSQPVSEILKLTDVKPLFGHKSGKQQKTHWICFMKN
jgi:SAM-dependent methyltransferase